MAALTSANSTAALVTSLAGALAWGALEAGRLSAPANVAGRLSAFFADVYACRASQVADRCISKNRSDAGARSGHAQTVDRTVALSHLR